MTRTEREGRAVSQSDGAITRRPSCLLAHSLPLCPPSPPFLSSSSRPAPSPFSLCVCVCAGILGIQAAKGLSLTDMLTYLHELVLQISYPPPVMNFILSQMSNIEYRLSHGTNDKLQLASLVGVFKQACQMTEQFQADKEKRQAIKAAAQ